jgi:hypothetical protein
MEQQVHLMLGEPVASFTCSSKTLTLLFLEGEHCCSGSCSPGGPVTRCILKLPGLEACPLEVGLEVVLKPFLGTALVVPSGCEFTVEELSWHTVLFHADNMASPSKLGF